MVTLPEIFVAVYSFGRVSFEYNDHKILFINKLFCRKFKICHFLKDRARFEIDASLDNRLKSNQANQNLTLRSEQTSKLSDIKKFN